MKIQLQTATTVSLLFAASFAFLTSLVLAQMSLPLALGVGLALALLIVVIASDELALYFLIFSMLLSPEFLVGGLGGGTQLGRGLTLRIDDMLIVIVGVAWLAKSAIYKELGWAFRTPLNLPIAAYTFVAVLATGLGMIAGRVTLFGGSFFVLKYIEYFVIYFMVVNNLRERKQFRRFLLALLATAAIASLIGILQIPSGERVSAPFEGETPEPNSFGGYLVLMLALVAGLYLTSESLRKKVLLACLAVLIFIPFLFTLSRASYLALVPMAGVLFIWSDRKRLLVALFALAMALGPMVGPKAVFDRVSYTIQQPPERGQMQLGRLRLDTSTSERLASWQEALFQGWPSHPVFGWGVTGYRFVDSEYVRVLAETGVVGLIALLWLQVSLFRQARAVGKTARDPLFRGVALGFQAGFIALATHSIGANTFLIVRIMEPFWFLAGMIMMIPQLEGIQPVQEGAARRPPPRSLQLPRFVRFYPTGKFESGSPPRRS